MRKPRQFDNNWPRDPHRRDDTAEKSMFLAKKAFLL